MIYFRYLATVGIAAEPLLKPGVFSLNRANNIAARRGPEQIGRNRTIQRVGETRPPAGRPMNNKHCNRVTIRNRMSRFGRRQQRPGGGGGGGRGGGGRGWDLPVGVADSAPAGST